VTVIEPKVKGKGKLVGKTFLFTGALKSFGRDEARNIVESLGGMTASIVSKKVDFVVVGEDPCGDRGRSCRTCLTEIIIATKMVSCPDQHA